MKPTYPNTDCSLDRPAGPTGGERDAAERVVRGRAAAEAWPEGPDLVLEMLGLADYEPGGTRDPIGRNIPRPERSTP